MAFHSLSFFLFLTCVLFLYRGLGQRGRVYLLLIASYFFYGLWDIRFLPPLIASTLLDFYCGKEISKTSNVVLQRYLLFLSVAGNLTLLFFLKYFWRSGVADYILGGAVTEWAIPIGISFYTFQSMSYVIDCYRGRVSATKSLIEFSLYVSFFPQLLAGPIERSSRLLPQITHLKNLDLKEIKAGCILILWAMYKKLNVSNDLSLVLENMTSLQILSAQELIVIGFIMCLWVYVDFSSYSDFARGLAKLFNIELMINFRPFYFSTTPAMFWKSWNISLTEWVRVYLFGPLSRWKVFRGKGLLLLSFIMMVLIGLWHQASLNWLLWGMAAGSYVVLFHFLIKLERHNSLLRTVFPSLRVVLMFSMYSILGNMHLAEKPHYLQVFNENILTTFYRGESVALLAHVLRTCWLLFWVDFFTFFQRNDVPMLKTHDFIKWFTFGLIFMQIVFFSGESDIGFIYFEF